MGNVYFATNRKVETKPDSIDDLFMGSKFNRDPADLRFVRVQYDVNLETKKYDLSYELYPDNTSEGSHKIFTDLQTDMKENKRDCVVFVHGYNNSWKDSMDAAINLATTYDINVVCFSWPSDNVLKYLDCKNRAVSSVPAFNRLIEKFITYMGGTTEICGQRVSLICHSMGNYILKNFLKSSYFSNEFIPFHNINLVAADTNHEGHVEWIDKINCLNDINIFINQDDFALDISDSKSGSKQKVRLGNTILELNSKKANYYNVTNSKGVGRGHGYFNEKKTLKGNDALFNLFDMAFHGERIEGMMYVKGLNFYTTPAEYNVEKKKWKDSINIPNF